jgi:hypothetical protein
MDLLLFLKRHIHITMRFSENQTQNNKKSKISSDVLAFVLPQSLPPRSLSYDSSVWLHFANFDSHKSSAGWESEV